MGTGRSRGLVLAWVVGLGVVGCSGSTQAASPTLPPLPSVSVSASGGSVSPSPSVSPAVVVTAGPPPTTPFTRQGAELFVRAYYATANRSLQDGRPGALTAYVAGGCECDNLLPLLRGLAEKGQHFRGHGYRLDQVRVETVAANSAVVRVSFALRQMRLVDSAGRLVDVSQDVHHQVNSLVISYWDKRWHITKMLIGRAS